MRAFNSRPHTEVDVCLALAICGFLLSTHDLTRRSTLQDEAGRLNRWSFNSRPHTEVDCCSSWSWDINHLSTHDLTRRSTPPVVSVSYCHGSFNSRPHTEVDWIVCTPLTISLSFNSRPHTEVDNTSGCRQQKHSTFQLTTSHGGRLHCCSVIQRVDVFQLTTSHGGRRKGREWMY